MREKGDEVTNDTLESLEREIRRLADNRNQTVEEFCAKAKQTDMAAYRLAAHVPELIATIRAQDAQLNDLLGQK
jgi:ABC-type transporter Mla subunit MlaD